MASTTNTSTTTGLRRLTVAQAVGHSGRHETTVLRALQSGELVGHQRTKGGRWFIKPEALEAWMDGTPYPAAPAPVPLHGRAVSA